jgi:hypothetical protein
MCKWRLWDEIFCFHTSAWSPTASRVHRSAAEGCSFVADHSGCFLTYPDFTIEIDDTDNCTIACRPILDYTLPFDFDARRHMTSRLASIQKAADHMDKSMPGSPQDSTDFPTVPVYSVSNSGIGETERINTSELKRYFGCRKFANWKLLESTGTGITVIKDREGPSTVGDFATIRRNKHGKLLDRPTRSLHTVGMDIGYGEGTSPGGFEYALTLVDYSTRHCWTYDLKTKTAESLIDALWSFFIDAGGMPTRIRCDFDASFVKGKVAEFLKQHRIKVTSAPPKRQSQNGLVERYW